MQLVGLPQAQLDPTGVDLRRRHLPVGSCLPRAEAPPGSAVGGKEDVAEGVGRPARAGDNLDAAALAAQRHVAVSGVLANKRGNSLRPFRGVVLPFVLSRRAN